MLFINAHIISADTDFFGAVEVIDGKITRIFRNGEVLPAAAETVDCEGNYLMPGFIDIHTHGALGCNWQEGKLEILRKLSSYKLTEGVTTVLPSTASLPHEELKQSHAALRDFVALGEYGVKLPGIHTEGCYFNPEARGAHYLPYIRPISTDEVFELHSIFPIARISLAPEMPGMNEAILKMIAAGIKVGAGHSKATFEQLMHSKTLGVDQLCHFCNQMTPLGHRAFGMVGAGLLLDDFFVEVIGDKVHICSEMLALCAKCIGKDKLILITDATQGAGMPDGEYVVGVKKVIIKNGVSRLADRPDVLSGGTTSLNVIFRNFVEIGKWPLDQAIKTVTANPATAIGLTGIGKIEVGYCADLVILDKGFGVVRTFVDGKQEGKSGEKQRISRKGAKGTANSHF